MSLRNITSNTRDSVSSGHPNTKKRVEKTTRKGVFLSNFEERSSKTVRFMFDLLVRARCHGLLLSPISKTNSAVVLSFIHRAVFFVFRKAFYSFDKWQKDSTMTNFRSFISPSQSYANYSSDWTNNQATSICVTINEKSG